MAGPPSQAFAISRAPLCSQQCTLNGTWITLKTEKSGGFRQVAQKNYG